MLDDREILLKRQNKIFFQISGAGHEAIQTAAGHGAEAGIRLDLSLLSRPCACLDARRNRRRHAAPGRWRGPRSHFGRTPDAFALVFAGLAHFYRLLANRYAISSSRRVRSRQRAIWTRNSDEITLVCAGEGATSEGEFWESINVACLDSLPLLFLIEDNGYAISVPVERQTAGRQRSASARRLPGLFRIEVDGTDFVESFRGLTQAAEYCRSWAWPCSSPRVRHPSLFTFAL